MLVPGYVVFVDMPYVEIGFAVDGLALAGRASVAVAPRLEAAALDGTPFAALVLAAALFLAAVI